MTKLRLEHRAPKQTHTESDKGAHQGECGAGFAKSHNFKPMKSVPADEGSQFRNTFFTDLSIMA